MQLMTTDDHGCALLHSPARTVTFPLDQDTLNFIAEFKSFFSNLKSPFVNPAGLAAPQVGVSLRIIIIQIPPEAKQVRKDVYDVVPPTILINPTFTPVLENEKTKDWEACYSVTNRMGEIHRYTTIQYEAYIETGEKISATAKGFLARLLQHEIGHINGQLYTDILTDDARFGLFDEMMALRKQELLNE